MGAPMARRLLAAGFPLTVWNRSHGRTEPFEKAVLGAWHGSIEASVSIAKTPREAVPSADVIATMLTDGAALDAVSEGPEGFLSAARKGSIWLDFSTVTPDDSRRLAARAAAHGVSFCDVPVAGSVSAAATGTLVVLAGGDEKTLEKVRPVLAAVSRGVEHAGPVGQGSALKLVNNLYFAVTMAGFAEALALGETLGIPSVRSAEWLSKTAYAGPGLKPKFDFWKAGGDPPQFPIALTAKDTSLMLRSAGSLGTGLSATAAVDDLYRNAAAAGWGARDVSHVIAFALGKVGVRGEGDR